MHVENMMIILVITLLGVVSKNPTVWLAGLLLLALTLLAQKFTWFQAVLKWLEGNGIQWGVIILTIAVLSTFALGKMGWPEIVATAKSYLGWLSIAIGIFVAYLGGKGVHLLSTKPEIMTGILLGTIIGVAIFRGVPVGPLIAAGILAAFSSFFK